MIGSYLFDVIRRRRWLIVLLGAVTALGIVSIARGERLFESSGTSVIRVSPSDENDEARALASLSRSDKIGSTYAFLAESDLIEKRTLDSLSGSESLPDATSDIKIEASVIPGSNLVEIRVNTEDPVLSADVALAVADELSRHIAGLGELYEIVALDPPTVPRVASRPAPGAVGIVGALMAGLMFATVLVLAVDHWWHPSRHGPVGDMHSAEYGAARIDEEKSRTDCGGPPFRLATMAVTVESQPSRWRRDALAAPFSISMSDIERRIERLLGPEDHLVYDIGRGEGTLSAILPQRDEADTAALLAEWRELARQRLGRRYGAGLEISVSSSLYDDRQFVPDDEATILAGSL